MFVVVRWTHRLLFDHEPAPFKSRCQLERIAQDHRNVDLSSLPLVGVHDALTGVDGDDRDPSRLQGAMPLGKHLVELLGRTVDEAVERDDAAEAPAADR